ncbi:30S ribosomal protein S6 modification protein [Haloferula helveola]|uniref:30S ribosomal protein S6 modification protein n=1 Tax=Haloferula helveola TaxID=490095 RepID=A0ABM7RAG7_9BACT|nr:30S ribosomal protein S6 modification protein [Haloferula helveola]
MRRTRKPGCHVGQVRHDGRPAGEVASELGLPTRRRQAEKLVIGRREWVMLPEFDAGPFHAKTDSGARSSSIHAEQIVLSDDCSSVGFFTRDHYGRRKWCEMKVGGVSRVKSSTGEAKPRIWVETELELPGGFRWRARLTLANRSRMLCSMLLGRRALSGYFLIDTARDHLMGMFDARGGH